MKKETPRAFSSFLVGFPWYYTHFDVDKGELERTYPDSNRVTRIERGEIFGEYAILYNQTRMASVRALSDAYVWGMHRRVFRRLIEELMTREYQENRAFLEKVPIFEPLTREERDRIEHNLLKTRFRAGQWIAKKGDQATTFYIVKEGSVAICKEESEDIVVGPGGYFGEQALYLHTCRSRSVRAIQDTVLLAVNAHTFVSIMGRHLEGALFRNLKMRALLSHETYATLQPAQIEQLLAKFEEKRFGKGENLLATGTGEATWIPLTTTINSTETEVVCGIGKVYVTGPHLKDPLFAAEEGVIAVMNRAETMVGELTVQAAKHKHLKLTLDTRRSQMREEILKEAEAASLKSLIYIKVLGNELSPTPRTDAEIGQGQFGTVYLVQNQNNGQLYALKCISKAQLLQEAMERQVVVFDAVIALV
jgi:cGMP-dependent protein kinase